MQTLTSHGAAMAAISTFGISHGAALPADLRAKFIEVAGSPSPVDRMCNVAELLYANLGAIADEAAKAAAMTLAGQCAAWAAAPGNGFHAMAGAGAGGMTRGVAIFQAMCRELGETAPVGTTWPAAADDPEPSGQWAAA